MSKIAVCGFILRMEDVGASDEAKSRYLSADILAKLTAEDQRAYGQSRLDTKEGENLQTLLEYSYLNNGPLKVILTPLIWTVPTMILLGAVLVAPYYMD